MSRKSDSITNRCLHYRGNLKRANFNCPGELVILKTSILHEGVENLQDFVPGVSTRQETDENGDGHNDEEKC